MCNSKVMGKNVSGTFIWIRTIVDSLYKASIYSIQYIAVIYIYIYTVIYTQQLYIQCLQQPSYYLVCFHRKDWFCSTSKVEFHIDIRVHTPNDPLCVCWWTTSSASLWRSPMLHLVATSHPVRFATPHYPIPTFIWHLAQHAERKINVSNNLLICFANPLHNIGSIREKENAWSGRILSF